MARQSFAMSPNYLAFVQGIRELHRLTLEDRDESAAAEAIRDAIDGPWEALSEVERKRVSGLSEDLYSISDSPVEGPTTINPQAQARLNEAVEARARGEWDRALELLRRWGKYVSPSLMSYLRGGTWEEAGDPETAVLFYEHAAKLDPENGNYLASLLHALDKVDPAAAQKRAANIIEKADDFAPVAVVTAASITQEASRRTPVAEAAPLFRRLILALEHAVERIATGDEGGMNLAVHCMAVGVLGFCYEFLGDIPKAIEWYTLGLRADPHSDALLVARGILLYGSSPRAITDFELAIRNNSPVVWPYFFLAHHYLMSGRYEDCRAMCERASRMPASDAEKSELAEWTAISQSELGFPAEMVRAAFEHSIRLYPSNDRARRNLAAFEEAVRLPLPKTWEKRHNAAVRASGMAARRYERAAA